MSSERNDLKVAEKEKWQITIDFLMIIGKYFESNSDFINVMKVAKRYHDLVEMYLFNPIQDYRLFENMETQHIYNLVITDYESECIWKYYNVFSEYKRIEMGEYMEYTR